MVRLTAWSSLGVHLPILVVLIGLMYWPIGLRPWTTAMAAGAALYLLWSRLASAIALRHHKRGLQLVRAGLFEEASDAFATSFDRLSRYSWVDRYRFVVLLDASAKSYREVALVNIGYCQLRRGATGDALAAYQAALRLFPRSAMARDGELECDRLLADDAT